MTPTVPNINLKLASSRILNHAPRLLFGREKWLDALDVAWANCKLHVYTLVAWGGVGKTSLVAHWVSQRLAAKGWLDVERYFDWSFYSQGTGESRQTSSDLFIAEALKFFGDPDPVKGTPWERGERLAGLVRQHRTLLILDGIEPLQYPVNDPQAGGLKDQALEALLQNLAHANNGLCVVTTREHLKNIESQATTEEQKLDRLEKDAAIALLRHLQITGMEEELEMAWKQVDGHALTLQLLGRYIADAFEDRDIRHMDRVRFEEADKERQGRSAFKVMFAYEIWLQSASAERQRELAILRLTGLFDRPIGLDCLAALRAEPAIAGLTDQLVRLKETQWNIALRRLNDIDLLTVSSDAIDAHPLIREYFSKQLSENQPEAFRLAHSRLFDHLCVTTPYHPTDVEGYGPLYQAVVHGCLAGRHQIACDKVYFERIVRGTGTDGFYSWRTLGAVGADLAAIAAFFAEPWGKVSPSLTAGSQTWLLNEAACRLRAVGRLKEALEPMRAGLEIVVRNEDWKNGAIYANNLAELEMSLGRLSEAIADARSSVQHADRSGDAVERRDERATLAEALQLSGQRQEAGKLLAEAEQMQQAIEPSLGQLCAFQGFRYCNWLLAPAERRAWRAWLNLTPGCPEAGADSELLADITVRAAKGLEWATNAKWLFDASADHLTLARASLLRAILFTEMAQPKLDLLEVSAALNGLRLAGVTEFVAVGLLTAGWCHAVRGEEKLARQRLDEAWQIAERGRMSLYMADIHLHRARLFRDKAELAKAAELIRKLGYGRRYDELADAEEWAATSAEAFNGWNGGGCGSTLRIHVSTAEDSDVLTTTDPVAAPAEAKLARSEVPFKRHDHELREAIVLLLSQAGDTGASALHLAKLIRDRVRGDPELGIKLGVSPDVSRDTVNDHCVGLEADERVFHNGKLNKASRWIHSRYRET